MSRYKAQFCKLDIKEQRPFYNYQLIKLKFRLFRNQESWLIQNFLLQTCHILKTFLFFEYTPKILIASSNTLFDFAAVFSWMGTIHY